MGAGSWESYHAITTLMFRYAECIDAADFDGIGALFAERQDHERGVSGRDRRAAAVADLYRSTNRVHDNGTLRTRHLTTNVIVDIDEEQRHGHDAAAFVVLQATPDLPLQPIVAGRYHDRFVRTRRTTWPFAHRHILLEQVGNVQPAPPPGARRAVARAGDG